MTYTPLFKLRSSGVPGMNLKYSVFQTPLTFHFNKILDPFSPKRDFMLDRYNKIPPDTLQWRVITHMAAKVLPKAVLRNRTKRRWANAFADALRNHGYHANGRSMNGPKDGKLYTPGLSGTLEIAVFSADGLTKPYAELVRSSAAMVVAVERAHRQGTRQGSQNQNQSQSQNQNQNPKREQPRPAAGRAENGNPWSVWEPQPSEW